MGPGLKREDLQANAQAKLDDAVILLQQGRFSNAYYLAGYAVEILFSLMDKACRELGIDRVDHLRANLPGHDAKMGRDLTELSSCFVREALELGAERFDWSAKSAMSGRREGTKVTGIGIAASPYTAGSSGFEDRDLVHSDRLFLEDLDLVLLHLAPSEQEVSLPLRGVRNLTEARKQPPLAQVDHDLGRVDRGGDVREDVVGDLAR